MKKSISALAITLCLTGAAGFAFAAAEPPAESKAAAPEASSGNVVDPGAGGAFAPGYKKKEAEAAAAEPAMEAEATPAASSGNVIDPGSGGAFAPGYKKEAESKAQ